MYDEVIQQAYRQLPAPLPIQIREPVATCSLIQFQEQEVSDYKKHYHPHDVQQLSPVIFNPLFRPSLHQIGDSFSELFACPVYKAHQNLILSSNEQFCSCRSDQNYRFPQAKKAMNNLQSSLAFESRFQSGNLALASYARNNRHVHLALQRDVNSSSKTTQWFYFKVSNTTTGVFTFHIVNYIKPFSMFKIGMKPCVFSKKKDVGWQRGCFDIEYRKNSIAYSDNCHYYTLSFSYNFSELDDQVYFSYSYPYTYSRLQRFLDGIQRKHADKMRRKVVAKTLGGNLVEMVSITNPQYLNKRLMFISARVHPGQTNSSFCCQGIISFLLSNSKEAEKLRDQFIIKIVPMINPDGVINGNYRCSISGDDLNRAWKAPSKTQHPQIFHLKKIILESQYKKVFYMDIHGHSKKKSSFMYGCISQKNPYLAKQLPYILSRKMSHFNYYSCNFSLQKSKEGTSRITLWRAGVDYSYTYELSFCGPQRQKRHFTTKDYQLMGIQLCKTLSGYFHNRILNLEVDEQLNKHCEQFYNNEQLMGMGNDQTNGSSSQLQDEMPAAQSKSNFSKQKTSKQRVLRKVPRHPFITEKTQTQKNIVEQPYKEEINENISKQLIEAQDCRKGGLDKTLYFKSRQSYVATKVNLTQISRLDFNSPSLQTFYGLSAERNTNSTHLEQIRSMSLRNKCQEQSQSELRQKSSDSFGILLPNVQKNNYKRYERAEKYKSSKPFNGESLTSMFVQNFIKSTAFLPRGQKAMNNSGIFNKLKRQISLSERIRSKAFDKSC